MDNEFDIHNIKELNEPIFVVHSSMGEDEGVIELTKFVGIGPSGAIEPLVMGDGYIDFVGEDINYFGCYTKEMLLENGTFLEIANAIKPKVDND